MKTRFSKQVRFLILLCLGAWAVGPRAVAQTAAGLAIQTYAGLSVTGAVGTVYSVEYVTDGDWYFDAGYCRSAIRYDRLDRFSLIGFRVLLAPGQP